MDSNQAASLNQTLKENVRNNKASEVKKGVAKKTSVAEMQKSIDTYVTGYEFGVRSGGMVTRDPVRAEGLTIIKSRIKAALLKAGKSIKDVSAKDLTAKANELLDKNPQVLEEAAAIVQARNDTSIKGLDLGSMGNEPKKEEAKK